MTASELRARIEESGFSPVFFTPETMRFFGDTMRNYGVRGPMRVEIRRGVFEAAYELYRRKPVKFGLCASAWFSASSFKRLHPLRRVEA